MEQRETLSCPGLKMISKSIGTEIDCQVDEVSLLIAQVHLILGVFEASLIEMEFRECYFEGGV